MAFSFLQKGSAPMAIDFGSSSTKLLQARDDDRPKMIAAAELPVPESARGSAEKHVAFLQEYLPALISRAKLRGKRAVISVPGNMTLVQHLTLPRVEGSNDAELVASQIAAQYGCTADAMVARHVEVGEVNRGGQVQREVIAFAIPRETIMRYVAMLRKMKIEVVGVHAAPQALVHAFKHLNRRDSDVNVTTCYVNLGWSNSLVVLAHGPELIFARTIDVGGKHFDEQIASVLRCDLTAARNHRLTLGDLATKSPATLVGQHGTSNAILDVAAQKASAAVGSATSSGGSDSIGDEDDDDLDAILNAASDAAGDPRSDNRSGQVPAPGVGQHVQGASHAEADDLGIRELLDTLSDEMSMCFRYYRGLFPERTIDRAIFVGGEARQLWLCRELVSSLGIPAQLGDPLSRLQVSNKLETPGLDLGDPQPGWAIACGLCNAPTDL